MATYKVYLGDPFTMKYEWKKLVAAVKKLLAPTLEFSSKYDEAQVVVARTAPAIADHELLCYVVPARGNSVIDLQEFNISAANLGQDGTTVWRDPATSVCEVYRHEWEPELLAKLVYHELMHNKLRESNRMHRRKGLASAVIEEDTEQKQANSRLMGRRLHRKQPQWLDGFNNATGSKPTQVNRVDAGILNRGETDPLAGL